MRNHQVAVLIERDQLADPPRRTSPSRCCAPASGSCRCARRRRSGSPGCPFRRSRNRSCRRCASRCRDGGASRFELHSSVAVVCRPLRCSSITFDAGVVLGRHEQQVVRTPHRRRDRDRVVRLERHLPLQIAVVRVDADHRAVQQRDELLEPADVDQDRRRVDVAEIVLAPRDACRRPAETPSPPCPGRRPAR